VVIANTGNNPAKPAWNTYTERTGGFTKVKNVITGKVSAFDEIELQSKECFVGELVK